MRSTGTDAPQRLPPEGAFHCERCGRLVLFRLVKTCASKTDARKVYAYLACPNCGHRATQTRWRRRGGRTDA